MKTIKILTIAISVTILSGCASYRISSNIKNDSIKEKSINKITPVLITEGTPKRKFKEISPIEISIKKLTIFHQDPTKEQANQALIEKAREIGADAVINVKYKSGIGFTTWGYIDANGTGVKFVNQ